jgi:hypothetical protein
MKLKLNVDKLLKAADLGPSKWELDNVVWNERGTNPAVLKSFLQRIKDLQATGNSASSAEKTELKFLTELANDMNEDECLSLLSNDDDAAQHRYIEYVARKNALEVLCKNQVSVETMEEMCKLSPEDFILAAKRTQDLMNSIRDLIIQGETLSRDVAGA